ncbi:MAG TPA: preprotein translocase subunit SecE [Thiolapillus brandeum]|uniref:Protein translocase subunit SecE n=1 Tax=Thiolapillus brandeum TaxID=1076588 RepID=A0A7C5IYK9_9GAMM|nr:preprotein translocase subunit SecE [Thiolapillus brandeum]
MNAQADNKETNSSLDTVKLAVAVGLVVGAIVGFYLLEAKPLWVRLLEILVLAGAAVFIALQTEPGRRIKAFFSAAQMEVRKVVWPTRQETVQTTLVIFLVVLVTSLFLWAVDSILFVLVRLFTGQGG